MSTGGGMPGGLYVEADSGVLSPGVTEPNCSWIEKMVHYILNKVSIFRYYTILRGKFWNIISLMNGRSTFYLTLSFLPLVS